MNKMDILNILFGLITIISFIFSIFIYFKTESKKVTEAAKNAMMRERIQNIQTSLAILLNTIDAIVQLAKKSNVTVKQLQEVARLARFEAYELTKQINNEIKFQESWKFGKIPEVDTTSKGEKK